ncbi:unnamed protein product [Amoebophrya sp. A120]|nr:unnamed protein product [Amoebophrya sp. A120]|eukprot:GSA120T00014747001.1
MHMLLPSTTSLDPDAAGAIAIAKQEAIKGKGGPSRPRTSTRPAKGAIAKQAAMKGKGGLPGTATRSAPASPGANHEIFSKANILPGGKDNEGGRTDGTKKGGTEGGAGDATNGSSENRKTGAAERINFNKSGSGGIPKNGAADGKSGAAGSGDGNRTPPQVTPPGPSGRRGAAASQMPEAAGTGVVATTSPAATGSVWRSVSHLLPSRRLTSPTTLMSGGTRERGGEMGGKGADGASGAGGSATAGPVLGESSVEEGEGHIASPTSSPAAPPEGSRPKRFSSTPIRAAGAALQAVGAAPSRAWQATVGRFARMAGDRAPEQLSAERSKGAGSAREVQATGQRSGAPGPARSPGEPAGGTGLMNPVNVYVQGVDPVVSGRTRKAQADEEFNQQIQAHLLRATAAQTAEVSAPSGSALPAALAAPPAFLRAENLTGRQLVYVQQLSLGAAGAPDLMRRLAASLASSPTGESSGHSSATHSAVQEFNHYIWAELKNRAKGGAQRTSEDALLPAPLPLSPHPAPPPASYQRAASAMTRGQRVIYVQRLDTDIPRQEVQTVEDFNRQVLMNMKLFEKANAAPEKMVVGPHGSKPPYSASHRNIVATPGQTNVVFVQGLDDDVRRFQSDYLRRWATADTGRPFAAGPSSSGRGQAAQVAAAVGEFNKKMQERLFVQHRGAVGDRNEAGKQDGTGAGQRATTAQETRKASGSDVRKTQEARRHDFLREGERRSPAERLEKDCADVLWKDLQASEYQQAVAPIVDKLEPICYRYAHEQQGASLSPWCVERAPSPSQCYDLLVSARVVFAEENPELARRAAQIQEIGPGKVTKMALLKGDLEKEIATLKKIRERIRKAGPGGEQQYKTTLRVLYNVILGKDERSEEALLTPNERRRLFLLFPDIADRAREGFKEMENMIRKLPAIAMQNNIHKRLGHADDAVVRAHFDPQTERLLRVAAEELYPGAHQEYWRLEPLPAERGREPGAAGRNGISFLQLQQIPVSSSLKAHTAQASISEVLPYTQQPGSHGFPASGAETRLSELITTCPGEIIAELFPREEGQGNAAAAAHLSPQCAISAASLAGVFAGLAFLIFLRCFCWASPNRRRRAGSNNSCRSKFFTCGSRNSSSAEGEGRTDYFPRARRRADSVSTSSSEEEGGETTGKGYDMQGARVQLQLERSKYEYDAEAGLTVHDEGATNPGDCAAATAGDGHAVLGITTCEGQGRAEDHPEDPSFSTQEAGSFCILLQNLQATPAAWTSVLARRFSFAAKLFHPTRIRLLFDGGARNTGDENHALQHPLRVVDPEAQQECGTGQESEQGQSLYDLLPIRMINNVAEDEPGSTSLMPRKGKTDLRQEHKRDSLLQHHLQLELPEQSQSGPDETEQQTLVQISDDEGPPHDAQHLHDRNVALHEGALLFSRYGRVGEDAPQHDHLHGDVVERYPASQHHLPHGGAAAGHFHAEGDQLRRYGLRTTAGTSNGPPTETHYEYGAASDTENEDEEQAVLQAFLLRCETSSTAGRQSVWFRVRATLQRYWNFAMILQDDEQIEIDNHGGEGLRPGTSTSG